MSQDMEGSLDEIKRAGLFWKEKLTGMEDWDILPVEYKRALENAHGNYEACFSAELTKKLLEISKSSHMSLYALLLAGLKVLLYKYTGRRDITVGAPAYLKSEFNRFIPLRDAINPEMTFKEVMIEVGKTLSDGYKNQFYPLQKTTGTMQNDELIQRFAKVLLALESIHDIRQVSDIAQSPANALTIVCKNDRNQLHLDVIYNTSMLSQTDVYFLIQGYESALSRMVYNLNEKIAGCGIISDIDKEKILFGFNHTEDKHSQEKTIHELFEEQISRIPQKVAVKHNNCSITYKELNDKANRLARVLRSKGVKKGIVAAIAIEHSIDLMAAILGVLKAGGAYFPINPGDPELRIQYMLEDSKAPVLITKEPLNSRYDYRGEVITIDDVGLLQQDNSDLQNVNDSNDLACIIYAPGSAGTPNGVMIEHKGITSLCNFYRNHLGAGSQDRIVLFSNVTFADFLWEAFSSLLSGAELHILPDEALCESTAFERFIKDNNITAITVPSLYVANLVPENITSLKRLIVSGLPPPAHLLAQWKGKAECTAVYGFAEATVYAGFQRLNDKKCESAQRVIGKPIDSYKFYIVDPDHQLQSIGLPGELYICGIGIARGYIGKPDLTKERFIDSPYEQGVRMYKTGALARWLPDGNVELVGRLDRQIEIRGYLVEPGEVEWQMLQHEFIQQVTVWGHEDKSNNRYLVAYYVSQVDIQPSALKKFLQNVLPYYMIPTYFIKVPAIPLTKNGKADIKLLPKPQDIDNADEYSVPQNETEENISAVWKKILKLERVSAKKSFLDMGGNSILLLKMVAELSKVYPNIISVPDVFSYPTIEQLAQQIIQKTENAGESAASRCKSISQMSLKLPISFFKAKGARGRNSAVLSYTFSKFFCSRISEICCTVGTDELQMILAAYLYTLSAVSSEKIITIQTIAGNEGNVLPVSANLAEIKDFETLLLHVSKTLQKSEGCDSYAIKDVNKIQLKKDPASIIPLFYNTSSCVFRQELLDIYDVVLGAGSVNGEISVIFRYDGLRIHSNKANELFSLLVNCIEEIATKLSQSSINGRYRDE